MATDDFQEKTLDVARETMRGQLRDLVLDELIHGRKNTLPWNMWPEPEQAEFIARVDKAVSDAVRRVVTIIAADGKRAIVANIESLNIKDGLKLVIKATHTEHNLLLLGNNVKSSVLITVTDDSAYQGGQDRKVEPLQQSLLDDGEDPDDDKPVFDGTDAGKGGPKGPKGPKGKK